MVIDYIKSNWNSMSRKELSNNLNISIYKLYNIAKELNLIINNDLSNRAKSSRWNKEEIDFLVKNYLSMTGNEISSILNRSITSIRIKAKQLGLKKLKKWENREILLLKHLYNKNISIDEISKYLGRTKKTIKERIKIYKFSKGNWKENEINLLQNLLKKGYTDKEISKKLNRSVCAIKTKRNKLFGNKRNNWTNKEIIFLKNNYSNKHYIFLMKNLPDRSRRQIRRMAKKLGLKKQSLLWSNKEISLLKHNYSSNTIDELEILFPNKTRKQIVNKSKCLKLKKDENTFKRCFNIKFSLPEALDKKGIWRTKILKRDRFCCKECGFIDNTGIKLQAHHIKPFRDCNKDEKYDINNGICLCIKCHKKTFGIEYKYIDKFENLLEA